MNEKETLEWLRARISQLCGLHSREISDTGNLFDLGIHSIEIVHLTASVERNFGVVLRTGDLFENPTVVSLSEAIEGRLGDVDD